jgi:CRP-like cAMP-binding protein
MQTQVAPMFRYWGSDQIAYGPVELPGIVAWIRQGRVKSDTWVFQDETKEWLRASQITELKMFFKKGTAVAPSPTGLKPDHLRRIKLLADMDSQQLESLLPYLEVTTVNQFAVLFRKGDPGDAMYSVLDGEVRAMEVVEGSEATLFTLGVGESFGELALLVEGERASDIVANMETKLLKLPAAAFKLITREAPALATPFLLAISRTLAHRSRQLGERLTDDIARARLASGMEG